MADFGRNLRQSPPSRWIACEYEFCPVREPLLSGTPTGCMDGARSQGSSGKRRREAFRFQRLRDPLSETVPEQRDERLSPRVYPQTLPPEGCRGTVAQQSARRQLTEQWLADDETQARITTGHRVTNAVAFTAVEKQHLIRFANSLIATEMADENATIGKYQFRCGGVLFCTQMRLATLAAHIADRTVSVLRRD
jgi:hypothetical protein